MKILAILGSPHGLEGATNELLTQVLESCRKEGAQTETIVLSKQKILYCVGCGNCLTEGECSIKDDVPKIHKKMSEVDGIIFASPVYLGTVTGQMKTFLDRCLPIGHRPSLQGKYGLAVVASAGIMDVPTKVFLENALTAFGVTCVGGICGIAVGPGMFEQEEIIAEMLSIIVNKAKKTHIMYKANLSYTLLCKYLDLLLSSSLVKYNREDKTYELTKRGELYLDHYAEYKIVESALINSEAEFDDKRTLLNKMLGGD